MKFYQLLFQIQQDPEFYTLENLERLYHLGVREGLVDQNLDYHFFLPEDLVELGFVEERTAQLLNTLRYGSVTNRLDALYFLYDDINPAWWATFWAFQEGRREDTPFVDPATVPAFIRDPATIPALIQVLRNDRHLWCRVHAANALGEIGDPFAIPALIETLHDRHEVSEVIIGATNALGEIGDPSAIPALVKTLQINHYYIPEYAKDALRKLGVNPDEV